MKVVARRSAMRMWGLAMAGIPLLVISLDVLTNRRLTNWLREIVFRPEDTQIYEPRDVIFAWAMVLFAGLLVAWGLKELFVPTKVVECLPGGLALKVNGPFRPPTEVRWVAVEDVYATDIEDEGTRLPFLVVVVAARGDLPDHPWGGRWISEREMGLLAEDWSATPGDVAREITEFAVARARAETRERRNTLASALEEE